ncbi:hypothetical protein [Novosphingobium lindaniclasticum]
MGLRTVLIGFPVWMLQRTEMTYPMALADLLLALFLRRLEFLAFGFRALGAIALVLRGGVFDLLALIPLLCHCEDYGHFQNGAGSQNPRVI